MAVFLCHINTDLTRLKIYKGYCQYLFCLTAGLNHDLSDVKRLLSICYFLLWQQGAWKSHYLKVSFQSLPCFSWCTWNEPCESPRGLMLVFPESGLAEKTIGVFLCMLRRPLWAQCLIQYSLALKMPSHLTIEGKCERSQEELFFQWKKTKVGGILQLGRSTGVKGCEWLMFFFFLNDCFSCAVPLGRTLSPVQNPQITWRWGGEGFSCCLIPPFFTCCTFTNIHNIPLTCSRSLWSYKNLLFSQWQWFCLPLWQKGFLYYSCVERKIAVWYFSTQLVNFLNHTFNVLHYCNMSPLANLTEISALKTFSPLREKWKHLRGHLTSNLNH